MKNSHLSAKVLIHSYLPPVIEVHTDGRVFFKSIIKHNPPRLLTDKYGNIKLGGLTCVKYEDKLTKKIRKAMKPELYGEFEIEYIWEGFDERHEDIKRW